MSKRRTISKLWLILFSLLLGACGGEEYYSTPQKTLERYLDSRMMANREEYESCLNAFRKEDREWLEQNYMRLCTEFYGPDCPGEGIATLAAVWADAFEPQGPRAAEVESAEIDQETGTAFLVVDGKRIEFIKKRGNWKIKGFFGVAEKLKEKYPDLSNPA